MTRRTAAFGRAKSERAKEPSERARQRMAWHERAYEVEEEEKQTKGKTIKTVDAL